MQINIPLHPLTNNPTAAWYEMRSSQTVAPVQLMSLNTPILEDKVRFVCMSDTHSLTSRLPFDIPNGDVFLHAGDFTQFGDASEVQKFDKFLGNLPHKHKIIIAGNHEVSFDVESLSNWGGTFLFGSCHATPLGSDTAHKTENEQSKYLEKIKKLKKSIKNAEYLEDSETTVYGLKIYGTPWQPRHLNWAFNLCRGQQCLEKWNKIPNDTDILLTHSPPVGYGDLCRTGIRAGCVELLTTVQRRVKPKFHVFGHVHEGYGSYTDGCTVFINASTCTADYQPRNPPIIFDVSLPEGFTKG